MLIIAHIYREIKYLDYYTLSLSLISPRNISPWTLKVCRKIRVGLTLS
jgi:hypothetical protein